jgi:hypothetical protein
MGGFIPFSSYSLRIKKFWNREFLDHILALSRQHVIMERELFCMHDDTSHNEGALRWNYLDSV